MNFNETFVLQTCCRRVTRPTSKQERLLVVVEPQHRPQQQVRGWVRSPELPSLSHGSRQLKLLKTGLMFRTPTHPLNLIDPYDHRGLWYDPSGTPLKPDLVSFSNLNPCPCDRCRKWLKNTGAFTSVLSEFSAGCAANKGIYADGRRCPCCLGDSAANKRLGFSIVTSPVSPSAFTASLVWNLQDFLCSWSDPGL